MEWLFLVVLSFIFSVSRLVVPSNLICYLLQSLYYILDQLTLGNKQGK